MSQAEQLQGAATARARTYGVLAALFSAPPSPQLAAQIRAGGLISSADNPLAPASASLTAAFMLATSQQGSTTEITAEYTQLFVLPSGLVPHESYYTDERQRVGGHITAAVQRFYDDAAAQLSGTQLELADHIGVELEFMKFLCELEAALWRRSDAPALQRCHALEQAFLEQHLLRWHRALCERIEQAATLELYRALARLTVDFLEAEREFVPTLTREALA